MRFFRRICSCSNRRRFVFGREWRILKHSSAKMELPHFIETGSAPECVSRQSSIGWRSSSRLCTAALLEEQDDGPTLVVRVEPRKNNRPVCSGCGGVGPAYDRLEERRFEFVPIWGILVFLAYRMRRVNCKRCGVKVELVPWCDGKNQLTTTYRWYLATWAKRLSWKEVGSIFRTSWDSVCRAVEHAVEWGLANRDLSKVTAWGIDEIAWARGHTYFTLVYDIGGESSLLAVEVDRTEASLRSCLESLGESVCRKVQYVCSDMWKPYLNVIAERLGKAVHVLDRFHVMQQFGKALDEVRAEEAKRLVNDGYEPILKRSRWCFLKAPGELDRQADGEVVRDSEVQPADGACVPAS